MIFSMNFNTCLVSVTNIASRARGTPIARPRPVLDLYDHTLPTPVLPTTDPFSIPVI